MRTKLWTGLSFVAVAVLSACATAGPSDAPKADPSNPSLVISDGAHTTVANDPNANRDFFFLPPLVPNPRQSPNWSAGQFNAMLQPTVAICELPSAATEADVTLATACGNYLAPIPFGTANNTVHIHRPGNGDLDDDANDDADSDGHYHVKWPVPTSAVVFYRLSIMVGSKRLGFFDLETPSATNPQLKNVNTGQFIASRDGKTLNIKFRIENRAFCTPAGDYSFPCATATISPATGGTVATTTPVTNQPVGIILPPNFNPTPVTFTVQPCGPGGIGVDIPTFSSCVEITSVPQLTSPLTQPGIVFVCDYPPNVSGISHDQAELVTLHAKHDLPLFNYTEALVEANGNCPVVIGQTGTLKSMFANLINRRWRAAGYDLGNLIQPKPLMAAMFLHAGGGGVTALQSKFQFALPCKMEITAGNGLTVTPGTIVTATAHVTDLYGGPCKPGLTPATVHFTGGVTANVNPDANGDASVQWTIGAGTNTLTATGFGLATAVDHGPRVAPGDFQPHSVDYGIFPAQTFDPFMPKYTQFRAGAPDAQTASPTDGTGGVKLKTGTLTFTATGIVPATLPLNYLSSNYLYKVVAQADEPSFPASFGSGGFAVGTAGFGSPGYCPLNTANPEGHTDWPIGTDILVLRQVTVPSAPTTITLSVQIDNDVRIWVDGNEVTPSPGGPTSASPGYYVHEGCPGNGLPGPIVVNIATAGVHQIAIRGRDRGGLDYLDLQVTTP